MAEHCLGAAETQRLAGEAAARFPGVAVHVINLEQVTRRATALAGAHGPDGTAGAPHAAPEGTGVPVDVVAVPAYVLDGRVIALGNPPPERLFARLAGA